MTTDKPGEVAMEDTVYAAGAATELGFIEPDDCNRAAAIIQAAIDEATAAVEASRDHEHARAELATAEMERMQQERDAARAALKACLDFEENRSKVLHGMECGCQIFSRETSNAYEQGKCPHQQAHAALLAEPEGGG